jgi:hypothetical protein
MVIDKWTGFRISSHSNRQDTAVKQPRLLMNETIMISMECHYNSERASTVLSIALKFHLISTLARNQMQIGTRNEHGPNRDDSKPVCFKLVRTTRRRHTTEQDRIPGCGRYLTLNRSSPLKYKHATFENKVTNVSGNPKPQYELPAWSISPWIGERLASSTECPDPNQHDLVRCAVQAKWQSSFEIGSGRWLPIWVQAL